MFQDSTEPTALVLPPADKSPASGHHSAANGHHSPSSNQWHHTFEIPACFSNRTEEAIKNGQLTKKARTEIVQALSSSILVHTKEPSSVQYNTVCQKLIQKFPTLKDEIGATGYVSCKVSNPPPPSPPPNDC